MKKINLKKIKFPKLKLPKIKKIKKNPNEPLKYKLNKEKLKQRIPLAIGILLVIITLIVFPNTLSRYASSGNSNTSINIAYSLLDVVNLDGDTIVDNVALPVVEPDGNFQEYVFEVRNYKDVVEAGGTTTRKRINVRMQYNVEILVTTNLPVTYYIEVQTHDGNIYTSSRVNPYLSTVSGACSDTAEDSIKTGLFCDGDNTYFYKFSYPLTNSLLQQTYGSDMADRYIIHYSLAGDANTVQYQDIIELLSIKIYAQQYAQSA
jgi:hypothetical protein